MKFQVQSDYQPAGDQPKVIAGFTEILLSEKNKKDSAYKIFLTFSTISFIFII